MDICNAGNRIVNCYVFESPAGYIMIDTGYKQSLADVENKLNKKNIQLSEIKYVFLTHAHNDHAGFLNELLGKNKELKVIISNRATTTLKRGQNSLEGGFSSFRVWMSYKLMVLFGKADQLFPAIGEQYNDRLIEVTEENKAVLDELLQGEILFTPGHTSDSISLRVGNIILCGDAAMNGFPSRKRLSIWIEDIAQYEKSWDVLLSKDVDLLYPGHGKPFSKRNLEKYKSKIAKIKLYRII